MNTQPITAGSWEVAEAAARTRSEAEARAEIGQRAFLSVVKTASEDRTTARLLFEAQSAVHDLNQRPYISKAEFNEKLLAECRRLCKGDMLKAQLLASAVVS